jgi:hypothetical protein
VGRRKQRDLLQHRVHAIALQSSRGNFILDAKMFGEISLEGGEEREDGSNRETRL